MSYEPMPPETQGQYPPGRGAPPPSVQRAVMLIFVNIALSVLTTILTFVFLDDIVEAQGLNLDDAAMDAGRTGAIVGAIVGLVVFGGLFVLLAIFIRKGANWARIVWTVFAAIGLVFGVIGLLADQPVLLLLVGIVSMVITVIVLVLLWTKESNAYFSGSGATRQA